MLIIDAGDAGDVIDGVVAPGKRKAQKDERMQNEMCPTSARSAPSDLLSPRPRWLFRAQLLLIIHKDKRLAVLVISHLPKQTHNLIQAEFREYLSVIHCGADDLLLGLLHLDEFGVHGSFDHEPRDVRLFRLANAKDTAES